MMRDHEDLEGLEFLRLLTEQVLSPIAWLLEGDYQEPSEEMKPFVFALMNRAHQRRRGRGGGADEAVPAEATVMSVRVITGDCRDVLAALPDESVHCVVTSPPYYGLRNYGVVGQIGLESSLRICW